MCNSLKLCISSLRYAELPNADRLFTKYLKNTLINVTMISSEFFIGILPNSRGGYTFSKILISLESSRFITDNKYCQCFLGTTGSLCLFLRKIIFQNLKSDLSQFLYPSFKQKWYPRKEQLLQLNSKPPHECLSRCVRDRHCTSAHNRSTLLCHSEYYQDVYLSGKV